MSEPRTIAGRALLGWVRPGRTREWWADRLAAVETEAAALGEGEAASRAAARVIHARLLQIDPATHTDAGAESCPDCEETARLVAAAMLLTGHGERR